ncbi:hypothetical protein [Staphylococcus phage vB_StaM_SA1]|nr:hypothetical protein [Staphylococcus phage vB_StaM_SA1]
MAIDKKYFLSKITDELIEVIDLSKYGGVEDIAYLPHLITSLQIKNNEEIKITSEEIVGTDENGKELCSGVMSASNIFPVIAYSVNNKKAANILIIDFDIIFNEVIENENFLKIKINNAYDMGINTMLFNKVIGDILDEENSLKIPFSLPAVHMRDLIPNSKNNKFLRRILVEVNREILRSLSQIRDHFNIEFLVSDACFSHIVYDDRRDSDDIDEDYYNLFDDYEISRVFETITDEKVIKEYLVRDNFK